MYRRFLVRRSLQSHYHISSFNNNITLPIPKQGKRFSSDLTPRASTVPFVLAKKTMTWGQTKNSGVTKAVKLSKNPGWTSEENSRAGDEGYIDLLSDSIFFF